MMATTAAAITMPAAELYYYGDVMSAHVMNVDIYIYNAFFMWFYFKFYREAEKLVYFST